MVQHDQALGEQRMIQRVVFGIERSLLPRQTQRSREEGFDPTWVLLRADEEDGE